MCIYFSPVYLFISAANVANLVFSSDSILTHSSSLVLLSFELVALGGHVRKCNANDKSLAVSAATLYLVEI